MKCRPSISDSPLPRQGASKTNWFMRFIPLVAYFSFFPNQHHFPQKTTNHELYLHDHTNTYSIAKAMFRNHKSSCDIVFMKMKVI